MFKLQSPSKSSPSDSIHLLRHFFPLLKTGFELIGFDAFQCFCCFWFHLFHIGNMFLFEDFFHPGKQKKMLFKARLGEQGWWGMGVMPFLVKNC